MTGPLTIAMLTSARTWRGSGVSFANIASGLIARGHRTHVFAGDAPVVESFAGFGVPATLIRTDDTGIRQAAVLAKLLRRMRADALLVDRPRDLRLGALASLLHPLALVNRYNLSRAVPPRDLLSRLAYRRVALTIFVSQTVADRALSRAAYLGKKPSRVIREAVDTGRFRPDPASATAFRSAHGIGSGPFVLAVGSLTPDKRYEFLYDALAWLGPSAPPLVVCGAGVQLRQLESDAADRRLDARFVGHLSPDVLRGAYNAATCFVHTGAIETFGLSVLEAMACGAAVLVVRGGALPEVVGQAGLVASPSDAEEFASLLKGLLEDEAERTRLGTAARLRAMNEFPLAAMQDGFAAAFESVCRTGSD